jgi:hypothetical protein
MTNDKLAELLKWWCVLSFGVLIGMAFVDWLELLK